MTTRISSRDWEAISAYLDGQLAPNERARLEKRLQTSADLRAVLEELRRTRAILRSQPRLRAPRNFTLTPEMVRRHAPRRPFPSLFPALGLASALASVLFVVVLLADLVGAVGGGTPAMVAVQATQEVAMEAPAGRQATTTQQEAPAAAVEAPAATEAPAMEQEAARPSEEVQGLGAPAAPIGTGEPTPYPAPAGAGDGLPVETAPVSEELHSFSQKSSAATPYPPVLMDQQPSAEVAVERAPQSGFWTPWRMLEAALGVIAVTTGLAALLLRRFGHH